MSIGYEEPLNPLPAKEKIVHEDRELDKWSDFGNESPLDFLNRGFSRNEIIGAILLVLVGTAFIKWG